MIRISLLLLAIFFGCTNKELPNQYIFSEPTTEWYVIVNGCKGSGNYVKGKKRIFIFPENGIILANMKNFQITKNDVFLINGQPFDPNSKNQGSYKLCYHMSSLNSGFNAEYLSKEYNIPLEKDVNPYQDFDLYFFRIGKSCDNKNQDLNKFFQKIWLFLLKNKVRSVK